MPYEYGGNLFLDAGRYASISKEIRRIKNLNQTALAQILGVSRQTISNLESQRSVPHIEVLSQLDRLYQQATWEENIGKMGMAARHRHKHLSLDPLVQGLEIPLTPDQKDQLRQEFQQDIQSDEGLDFWFNAALLGFGLVSMSYLLEEQQAQEKRSDIP